MVETITESKNHIIVHGLINQWAYICGMKEQSAQFNVEGMTCGHCADGVKNLIEKMDGVQSAEVVLSSKEAKVVFDSSATNSQTIINSINSSNSYKATEK